MSGAALLGLLGLLGRWAPAVLGRWASVKMTAPRHPKGEGLEREAPGPQWPSRKGAI